VESLSPQKQIVFLLDAAERAGITPFSLSGFQAYIYLANALAPLWGASSDKIHFTQIMY